MLTAYKKMSVQAKAAIWFVVCNLLQKGINFITVPIFTRLMSTEQYGFYNVFSSWSQVLTILTSLYLYYGVFNNAMVKFENDRDRYIASQLGLIITITSVFFLFFVLLPDLWCEVLGLSSTLIALMFLGLYTTPAYIFWICRKRFDYQYRSIVFITLLKSICNPILGIIAVLHSDDKTTARIIVSCGIEAVFSLPIMVYYFFKGKSFYHKQYWHYAFILAIPLLPHYLSEIILNQGDRIMIDKMIGASEVALYSVAYSVGQVIQLFTSGISSSFTPWYYNALKEKRIDDIKKKINALLLVVSVLIIMVILLAPEIVYIVGSEKYKSAMNVVPPVAASVFFTFLYGTIALPQFYFEKTKFMLIASISTAILNIILNYIFINLFGYIAAAYTTLACYIFYSIGHYIVGQRLIKEKLGKKSLYDLRFIIILSVAVIFIGITSNITYGYPVIRYLFFSAIVVGSIIKRHTIIDIFSQLGIKKSKS